MIAVGIDPGTKALGWAIVDGGALVRAGLIRATGLEQMVHLVQYGIPGWNGRCANALVIERAEIYPDGNARPNDLGQLLILAGACAGAIRHNRLFLPYPKEWKGQVPKELHHRRLRKGLTDTERDVVDASMQDVPPSLRHNVLDAIGLARWGARRT